MTRTSEPRPLLPDTHVWLWFMLANPELAISEQGVLNRAAASGQLRIAAISVWEACRACDLRDCFAYARNDTSVAVMARSRATKQSERAI